jgi:hypothetical protein
MLALGCHAGVEEVTAALVREFPRQFGSAMKQRQLQPALSF